MREKCFPDEIKTTAQPRFNCEQVLVEVFEESVHRISEHIFRSRNSFSIPKPVFDSYSLVIPKIFKQGSPESGEDCILGMH